MACLEKSYNSNFLTWNKVSGSLTLSQLQSSGLPSLCDTLSPDIPLSPAPQNLVATAISSSTISLFWDNVAGADSYKVYRSLTLGGTYTVIEPLDLDKDYDDTTCDPDTEYFYKVSAVIGGVESALTEAVNATTYDADAQAWIDRMTSPTDIEKISINTFVIADKASGNWVLRDEIWIRSLGSVNGLIGAKGTNGIAYGGVTWSVNGIKYNGTTAYIDDGFDLGADGVNYIATDARIDLFIKTAASVHNINQCMTGVYDNSRYTELKELSSGNVRGIINKNSSIINTENVLSNTYYSFIFYSTPKALKNGVNVTNTALTNTPGVPTGYNLTEGARNNIGTINRYTDMEIAFKSICGANGFDESASNTNVRQLLTDLGVAL